MCNYPQEQYVIVNQVISWRDANVYCRNNFDTHLATITNRDADNYVRVEILTSGISGDDAWIGCNDFLTQGSYQWIDGTGYIDDLYNGFASGQPDTSTQNCCTWSISFGGWDDGNCDTHTAAFVCNAPS